MSPDLQRKLDRLLWRERCARVATPLGIFAFFAGCTAVGVYLKAYPQLVARLSLWVELLYGAGTLLGVVLTIFLTLLGHRKLALSLFWQNERDVGDDDKWKGSLRKAPTEIVEMDANAK